MRSSQCKQTLCTHVMLQTDMQTHAWSPTPRWKTWSRMADLIWPDLRRETLIYRKCKLNILRLIISRQTDKCRRSKQKCPNSTTHTPNTLQCSSWHAEVDLQTTWLGGSEITSGTGYLNRAVCCYSGYTHDRGTSFNTDNKYRVSSLKPNTCCTKEVHEK